MYIFQRVKRSSTPTPLKGGNPSWELGTPTTRDTSDLEIKMDYLELKSRIEKAERKGISISAHSRKALLWLKRGYDKRADGRLLTTGTEAAAAYRRGQWAAYDRMLNWINAQDDMCLACRKVLQKQLMDYRPTQEDQK